MLPDWFMPLVSGLAGGGLIGAILLFIATRKRDVFAGNLELQKFIDTRADLAAEKAAAPLRAELVEVRAELKRVTEQKDGLHSELDALRQIIRRHFLNLFWWEDHGRVGHLTLPSDEEMQALGVDDLAPGNRDKEPQP